MRINSIDIENFRCVKRLKIELHEKTNIFVGINGSGKSAVLECLSVLLSRLLAKIRSPEERGRLMFSADDVTIGEGTTTCKIGISAAVDGDPANVSWTLIKHRRRLGKGRKTSDLKALTAFAESLKGPAAGPVSSFALYIIKLLHSLTLFRYLQILYVTF